MGTASFSFTENAAYMPSSPPSVYAKHTIKLVRQNIVVSGSSFNYSGKDITPYDSYNTTADTRNSVYDDLYVRLYVNINGTYTPLFSNALDCFKYQICNAGSVNTDITGNIYRDVFLPDGSHRKSSITINTSTLFNSNNKTKKVEDIYARIEKVSDNSVIRSVHLEGQAVRYGGQIAITTASGYSVINTVALDAPPTYDSTNVTLGRSPAYAGYTRATVTISSLSAKYGGDISSAVLKIGNQTSASRTTNGDLYIDLNASGIFTPQVIVTDSRGQTTTKNLASITVLPYIVPSVSFDIERTLPTPTRPAPVGKADDEGESAVITATFNFTGAIARLQAPTIVIKDPSGVTLQPTVTWYTDRALTTPISDWSAVMSGSTVYALVDNTSHNLFNTQYSYQISLTPNDIDVNSDTHSGTTITQILGSAFYTMDFLAGGHGIAFGKASTEEAFDVNMEAIFRDGVYFPGENNRVFSIKRDSDNVDVGWDWTNKDGAGLGFRGADASSATFGNPGGFTFYARDENNSCYLDGYTDGRLTWNGESVFGELSCAGWSSPNNYARFLNGLQICWGRANFPPTSTGGQEITVTFPKAFSSVPTVMMSWQDSTNVGSYMEKGTLTALSSTTATVLHAWANRISATSNWWANYLAIGPWR